MPDNKKTQKTSENSRLFAILLAMFTEKELNHVLHLSHLEISPQKKPALLKQLQSILTHVELLKNADLNPSKQTNSATSQTQLERTDTHHAFKSDLLSKNAPEWENNAFKVPKIT